MRSSRRARLRRRGRCWPGAAAGRGTAKRCRASAAQPCCLYTPRGYRTQGRPTPEPTTKSRTANPTAAPPTGTHHEVTNGRTGTRTRPPGHHGARKPSSDGMFEPRASARRWKPSSDGMFEPRASARRWKPSSDGMFEPEGPARRKSRRVTECSSPEAALSGRSRRQPRTTGTHPGVTNGEPDGSPDLPEPTTESRTAPGLDQSSPNPQAVRTISARCPRRPLLLPRSPDRRRCGRRPRRGPRRPGSRPPRCGSPRWRSSRCSRRRWPGRRRTSR